MDDGKVHLFASDDGALSFSKVLSRPIHDPSGDTRLHVRFVYPSGHFPVQIWFYGTIVARCGTGSSAPDVVARLVLSGDARQGATLTASDRAWGGDAPSIAFQWRRCDAFGSSCADIVGGRTHRSPPTPEQCSAPA